jgi:hypothetical protein
MLKEQSCTDVSSNMLSLPDCSRCRGLQRKNRHVNGLSHLRNLDELAHGRHTVNEDVDNIRTRRCDGLVRGHLNGNGLAGAAGLEALGVEPYHAVTHVNGVGNESTIVEVDLDSLGVGRSSELDGESGAIGNEVLAGELNVGRTSRVTLEVTRSVDLVAELSDVWVLCVGGEDGLLDGVGARDEESTIKKKESDTVVQTCNVRLGAGSEALALGLGGVVEQDLESRVFGDAETLSSELSTVDPSDGTISKEGTLNHTTTFGHGVHLPLGISIERLDATAGWITGGGDVLVRTTTADDDVRVVVVLAGQRHHDRSSSVGVCAVGTGKVSKLTNHIASADVEDFGRLGDLDEEVAILHQVHEGVHVVRLVLAQDFHVEARALGRAVGVQDLVGRVVVLRLAGVKTVLAARSDEDFAVRHDLNRGIPTRSVELRTRLDPGLAVEFTVIGSLKESDALEAVTDSGVNEVEGRVTTKGSETTISKENTSRAESVGLVGERDQLLGVGVVLGRIGVLAVGELELGVVLDLVQENNATVLHQTSVHSRHTGATLLRECAGLQGNGSRAGGRGWLAGCLVARTILATLTAMSSGVTTVSVHATARALGPGTANGVAELGTTASIDGWDSSGLRVHDARGLTKNWLAGACGRGRTSDSRCGGSRGGDGSSVLATVLASIRDKTVAIRGSAVTVRRAAASIGALCITDGAAEVLTATTVVPGGNGSWFRFGLGLNFFAAAGLAAISTMGWGVSAPSIGAAAGSGVSSAVGVAEQVSVGRATFAVEGVLGILSLFRETNGGSRPGDDLGVIALGVGGTTIRG